MPSSYPSTYGSASDRAKEGAVRRFFRRLTVSVVCLAIGFAGCYFAMKFGYLPSFDMPVLAEQRTTITTKQLAKIIEPASDLVTSRYRYTDADTINNSKELLGFDVPLTRNMVVFTYDGVVGVGFDIKQVQFQIEEGVGDEKGTVNVVLPKLKVIQNEIDMDSFDYAYQEHSIFNPKGMDYVTAVLGTLKKNAKQRALEDEEFMGDARSNAETTILHFLEAAHVGDYYTISITWQGEEEAAK